jgi:hypothetical protein
MINSDLCAIYQFSSTSLEKSFSLTNLLSEEIFAYLQTKVEETFAEKFAEIYDFQTIFEKEMNATLKYVKAMSEAKQALLGMQSFPKLDLYFFDYHEDYYILFNHLNHLDYYMSQYVAQKYKLIKMENKNKQFVFKKMDIATEHHFESLSFKKNVFNLLNVTITDNWVKYIPHSHDRAVKQSENILLNLELKKRGLSLTEKLNFLKQAKGHPQFKVILEKVTRVIEKEEVKFKEAFEHVKKVEEKERKDQQKLLNKQFAQQNKQYNENSSKGK